MEHLLEVKELETSLLINKQWFPTIDKVSFKLDKGKFWVSLVNLDVGNLY